MSRRPPRKRQGPARGHFRHSPRPWSPPTAGRDYWLYGLHAARAALANPARRIHRILVADDEAASLAANYPQRPRPEAVERGEIDRLVPNGVNPQGIALLVSPLPERSLDEVPPAPGEGRRIVVVLDQITDPRNMGAILRSAAVFGAAAVVTTERRSAPESGALAKAASGALDAVPLVRVPNLARALRGLKDLGYWAIALDHDAEETLTAADFAGIALVLGAEGHGLRTLTRELCDKFVRIPSVGGAAAVGIDSLNVASAAAIALYKLALGD
jgi:23S rRNA (guanosine2251-2'-O)-methyltransferase